MTPLFFLGNLGISLISLFGILQTLMYAGICIYKFNGRSRRLLLDLPIIAGIVAVQFVAAIIVLTPGSLSGISVLTLAWVFLLFMIGYGIWRVAGGQPLHGWPWPRFGFSVTLTIFLTDCAIGMVMPTEPGRAWILGGAGWRDALILLPPFLTGAFWLILDCRSPMVFCSKKCRTANACQFPNQH